MAHRRLVRLEHADDHAARSWRRYCCVHQSQSKRGSPKFSPIMSSTGCAAKSPCPGSIVIVISVANSWRSLKLTDRPRKAVRRADTRPSHELADCAGDYEHPGYGRITITYVEGTLNWSYRGMSKPLAHRHYDTVELPEAPGPAARPAGPLVFHRQRWGLAGMTTAFHTLKVAVLLW